jgi:MFS family permease
MLARSTAWLARGVRTPARKALMAAAVPPEAYGRAFGFERMMDTLGAIFAPLTALWLLRILSHNYHHVLLWTLVPGLGAALCFGLLVREKRGPIPPRTTFLGSLRELPVRFRLFLVAVGIFGLGDFSHTLLILYATQRLTPTHGAAAAASVAILLYLVHNIFYAGFAYVGGWLGDRVRHRKIVLAGGYAIAMGMAAMLTLSSANLIALAIAFSFAGAFTGVVEAMEDSMTASIVPSARHGIAYGTLAAVNAVGDFASSLIVGVLWTALSAGLAFSISGTLFAAAFVLILVLRDDSTAPLESAR